MNVVSGYTRCLSMMTSRVSSVEKVVKPTLFCHSSKLVNWRFVFAFHMDCASNSKALNSLSSQTFLFNAEKQRTCLIRSHSYNANKKEPLPKKHDKKEIRNEVEKCEEYIKKNNELPIERLEEPLTEVQKFKNDFKSFRSNNIKIIAKLFTMFLQWYVTGGLTVMGDMMEKLWYEVLQRLPPGLKQFEFLDECAEIIRNILEKDEKVYEYVVGFLKKCYFYDEDKSSTRSTGTAHQSKYPVKDRKKIIGILISATTTITTPDLKFLLKIIDETLKERDKSQFDEVSLLELTAVLYRIAQFDTNKKELVKCGAIPVLVKILEGNNVEEQKNAVKTIWSIAFDNDFQKDILENKWHIKDTLIKLSKSVNDDIKDVSTLVLRMVKVEDKTTYQPKTGRIMISYHCEQKDIAVKICGILKQMHISVWMHVDHKHDSPIATWRAIEQADIFLMCFSQQYKNCNRCRAEAYHASSKMKVIVPVKVDEDYEPDGWITRKINKMSYFSHGETVPFGNALGVFISVIARNQISK